MSGTSRVVLVGAGGAGREVRAVIDTSPAWVSAHGVDRIVFVDDGATGPDVVSSVADYVPAEGDLVLCTVVDPSTRRRLTDRLALSGCRFGSFVHDRAVVCDGASVGEGTIVYPNAVISTDVEVGAHCFVNTAAVIGHDVVVGDHVTVSGAAQLLGGATVGDGVFVGPAATVLPRARIGADSTVGAGSVVLRRVRPGTTVFGNPAVVISKKDS